jgi:hypothetical protein
MRSGEYRQAAGAGAESLKRKRREPRRTHRFPPTDIRTPVLAVNGSSDLRLDKPNWVCGQQPPREEARRGEYRQAAGAITQTLSTHRVTQSLLARRSVRAGCFGSPLGETCCRQARGPFTVLHRHNS